MAAAPAKLDLVQQHKADYAPTRKPVLLDIAPGTYLCVRGKGGPGGAAFQQAVGSLYSLAYTLKFQAKAAGRDFKVAPLEAIWDRLGAVPGDLDAAAWRLLVRVPDGTTKADLDRAAAQLAEKGRPPAARVALQRLAEGPCVQMLHVGPYGDEPATVERMHAYAKAQGRSPKGPHHEIYLSDPRRVPPARLRTLLRQPVRGGAAA